MLTTVRNNQKDVYMPILSEVVVYIISNLKVVPGPAINFYYKTKMQKVIDIGRIPRYKFDFKEFMNIPNYVTNVKCFISQRLPIYFLNRFAI